MPDVSDPHTMTARSPKSSTRTVIGSPRHRTAETHGFALVTTLTLMVLLAVLTVGLLSLSAVSLRSSSQASARSDAQANARLALMIAIGELQKEMGPDMRVSAKSAIFDQNPDTEEIEGVEQPHWLASYESWGNWLNASYKHPETGTSMMIADTYTPRREGMFRRWLLSMPEGMEGNVDAPINPNQWDDKNSVVLVGEGSMGTSTQETRAYLNAVGETGRSAWWIGPENHKARIDKAKNPRALSVEQWETAQADTAEVGIGALQGLGPLDSDAAISDRLVTVGTLGPAGIEDAIIKSHFFDLTESSRGVLASVRTGHLKKDLSLLFEKPKATLPDPYRFDPGDVREPSIRPMSAELAGKAVLGNRHFAPWNRMRHFYRMYRQDSDAEARAWASGGTNGSPGLKWDGTKPWTGCNLNWDSASATSWPWPGEDTYVRFPVLTSVTYILSLKTDLSNATPPARYSIRVVATPVLVYWNPYNVELRVPDKHMVFRSYLEMVHPIDRRFFLGDTLQNEGMALGFDDDAAMVRSGKPPNTSTLLPDIVFKPGQFRIFAPDAATLVAANQMDIIPGFDPQAFGGLFRNFGTSYTLAQNPKIQMRFSHKATRNNNFFYGNTPASLSLTEWWADGGNFFAPSIRKFVPFAHQVDWSDTSQLFSFLSSPAAPDPWFLPGQDPPDGQLIPVAYFQLALKGIHDHDYPSIGWEKDWRSRNWLQAPPFYHGKGLFMSEDPTIGHTQRIDSPFEMRFGPLLGVGKDVDDIIQHVGESAIMGLGERVTAVSSLELPTAPIGSLGGFGAMTLDPGWVNIAALNPDWKMGYAPSPPAGNATGHSLYRAPTKATAYQSGVTGPGIGNSFLHPMIPRTEVYQFLDNSISMDMKNIADANAGYSPVNTKAYCDYWDHVLLLNDTLWDDYFVSSLADQTRPGASANVSLADHLDKLVNSEELTNSRYMYHSTGEAAAEIKAELEATDGYLKAAAHLMIDGMFNVNSTSVAAWHALFAGIRERQLVYRDKDGVLKPVAVPSDKRIALSRFGVATTDQECTDPEFGITRDDGMQAWSGVRFLDDNQLRNLAEECVKQVKRRGPFLNFSEFINRRLADDDLGTMGALQSAIDYDDASPEADSINYPFKSNPAYMLSAAQLGTTSFETPEAAVGSRFAGIPGYVIQSDLLNPIANTLAVRDDTFRIRAYGESLDKNSKVIARAWCEAVVQRLPEYSDESNSPEIPARLMSEDGVFSDNSALTPTNRRYGRKFRIESFRWLTGSEI